MVGPFIFLDHMGPVEFAPGLARSADVRPHPHIGLSTVTYLFEGEVMHRDSVGSEQPIRPGEVNWMTAGRGITHSERFDKAPAEYPERAAYIVEGEIEVGGQAFHGGQMLVFKPGRPVLFRAATAAVVMLLGGAPVGERFIEWNFVSSSRERIEQAKADWRAGR